MNRSTLWLLCAALSPALGCTGSAGADGASASIETSAEPAGDHCPSGGIRVEVHAGSSAPLVTYVCDGGDGKAASVAVTDEPPGDRCPAGGKAIVSRVGDGDPVTSYVCNGVDGQSVVITAEAAGKHCPAGGVRLQAGTSDPQYVCNGEAGSGIAWSLAAENVQAEPNHGYVADGGEQITVTLPPSSALEIGDEVDLAGQGVGGFVVAASAGQVIRFGSGVNTLRGVSWRQVIPGTAIRYGAASSANGRVLAFVSPYSLYLSTDRGDTWSTSGPGGDDVACSADGERLAVAREQVQTSADAGATWAVSSGNLGAGAIASSADGRTLITAGPSELVCTSMDAGQLWMRAGVRGEAVASSADGARLVVVEGGGACAFSTDSGASWESRSCPGEVSSDGLSTTSQVASSADASSLVMTTPTGYLWTSVDGGVFWTQRAWEDTWRDVCTSADGTFLVAIAAPANTLEPARVAVSEDSGKTWTGRALGAGLGAVACSADGSTLLAVGKSGVYLSAVRSGSDDRLRGSQGAGLRLLYTGSGSFLVMEPYGALYAE